MFPRKPKFRRFKEIRSMRLMPRDLEIVRHVFRYRFLTSRQILSLVGGSPQQLLRRLQLLYHHAFLDRPKAQLDYYHRGGSAALIYGIGHRGAKVLKEHFGTNVRSRAGWKERNQNVTSLYLQHTLMVADVVIALERACQKNGTIRFIDQDEIVSNLPAKLRKNGEPCHWNVTTQQGGKAVKLGIVPDRIFALQYAGRPDDIAYFFVEADRATMPVMRRDLDQSSFYRKLLAYHQTWKQGVFDDSLKRFRVLTVTTASERVNTLLSACEHLSTGKGLFLFADKTILLRGGDALQYPFDCGHLGKTTTLLESPSQIKKI